jgi:hypothetical protein
MNRTQFILSAWLAVLIAPSSIFAAETNVRSTAKPAGAALVVNGHLLHTSEQTWVRFVAKTVVPQLRGTREERIKIAAEVSWWGLKEGIYRTKNPITFSSCSRVQPDGKSKDVRLGPLESCEKGRAWQVGLAAVQVPNFSSQKVLDTVDQLWPGKAVPDVLKETFKFAGIPAGHPVATAILNSTGDLQKSWLLRHPVVGFTLVDLNIRHQCINSTNSYCFGTGWEQTRLYAPTREGAMRSIADLKSIYERFAPK